MLEAKETNGAKMATLPARHPVSEGLGLSDLQILFLSFDFSVYYELINESH